VKGYFFIDFISSVPYTWFYPTFILPPGPNSNSVLLILEFLPILKLIRIPTVQKNIQQINAVTYINYLYKYYLYKYYINIDGLNFINKSIICIIFK